MTTHLRKLGLASCLLSLTLPTNADTLLGVYYGNQGWEMDKVVDLESWQGKRHAIVNLYTNWSPSAENLLFTYQLNNVWSHGSIPLITWEPTISGSTPNDIETRISDGEYDDYIDHWGRNLKRFLSGMDGEYGNADDRRAYLRLAHEPNGTWYPWSASLGENTPNDYISMWQRTHDKLSALGLDDTHVQWLWAVNNVDIGEFTAEQYYPGDNYVDWVGIDGFNWGSDYSWSHWQSSPQIFEDMRNRLDLLAPEKPVALPEVATTSNNTFGIDSFGKDAWISQFSQYIKDSDIRMLVWFNEDKEADWQVFDGENGAEETDGVNTYPAYKAAVSEPNLIAPDATKLRLLTDKQFQGDLVTSINTSAPEKTCKLHYTITNQWSGGYVAKVKASANFLITKNWSVAWAFKNNETISYAWNTVATQNNNNVSATPPSWWKWMMAGSNPSFGFVGKGKPVLPEDAKLNGLSCEIVKQ